MDKRFVLLALASAAVGFGAPTVVFRDVKFVYVVAIFAAGLACGMSLARALRG